MPPCRVAGCTNAALARGLCSRHYQAEYRKRGPPCLREDCDRPSFAKGLCVRHYQAAYRASGAPCRMRRCESPAFARGLCVRHYHRWYRGLLEAHGASTLATVPAGEREKRKVRRRLQP